MTLASMIPTPSSHPSGVGEATFAEAVADTFAVIDAVMALVNVASAVNSWQATNALTAGVPKIEVIGSDTNISARWATKGTGSHIWQTNATDRGALDGSGRFVIGAIAAATLAAIAIPNIQVLGDGSATAGIGLGRYSADNGGPAIHLYKSRHATIGSQTIVQSGDALGSIRFGGSDGTNGIVAAQILVEVDGTPGSNDMPGRIIFSTTADGASSVTERMRITSAGVVNLVSSTGYSISGFGMPNLNIVNAGDAGLGMSVFSNGGGAFAPRIQFNRSRGTTTGSMTVVQNNDAIGNFYFGGADGTNIVQGAFFGAAVDGTPGTNDMPMRLTFATSPDGSASPSEAFRISQNGAAAFPRISTTASAANAFLDSGSSPANNLLRSTSSLRYKDQVEDLAKANADHVLSLRPVWYRSKAERDRKDWSWYGLIAEEVAEIDPRLVHWGYRDEDREIIVHENENAPPSIETRIRKGAELVPDGVMYDRICVLLIDQVKSLRARVASLESLSVH